LRVDGFPGGGDLRLLVANGRFSTGDLGLFPNVSMSLHLVMESRSSSIMIRQPQPASVLGKVSARFRRPTGSIGLRSIGGRRHAASDSTSASVPGSYWLVRRRASQKEFRGCSFEGGARSMLPSGRAGCLGTLASEAKETRH
jgi:hypothetical protein